ncbi:MAG: transketolase [Pseudomonadota bacterium]
MNDPASLDSTEQPHSLAALAQHLRKDCLVSTSEAGSGHPTTCMSAAEIMTVLFFAEMAIDPRDPFRPGTDHLVLSKGHAAPLLWASLKKLGAIAEDTRTLRKVDSPLEGHPTPRVPGWVRVATGSLGQGLSVAMGMALGRRFKNDPGRIYCLMGDGEIAEGSVWEAAALASHYQLDNLCAVVDVNGLGQSGRTMHQHDLETVAGKLRAFGWQAITVNGHDVEALARAFEQARHQAGRPSVLVAATLKGKGAELTENKDGWHGKPLKKGEELDGALAELAAPAVAASVKPRSRGQLDSPARQVAPPASSTSPASPASPPPSPPYRIGQAVATREAYGDSLARLGMVDNRIVVLDSEVKNSTYAEKFKDRFPERFVECFIAEQNMVGAAMGLAAEGFVPFASTFAAFLSRAYDFIRVAAYSAPKHLVLCGSHAGVSIGEDGPTQMGLEDLAMMRSVVGSTVFYPADAMAAARLVERAAAIEGIVYLRTTRPKTPVLYSDQDDFPVGGCKVLRRSAKDVATVVAAGITLYEALAAHDRLSAQGIEIRVIDAYSIKPLDVATIQQCADETHAVVTVEDHYAWGGLGEAVAAAVRAPRFRILAVREVPRSASPTEQMARHGIDADAIVRAVQDLIRS